MSSEVHALVLGVDYAYVIRNTLEAILDRNVVMDVFIEHKTVLDVIARYGKNREDITHRHQLIIVIL